MKLGGGICIRNGNVLDYCWREAVQSLLGVCDVVSVSDGESDDGTQQELRAWAEQDPRLILNVHPWTDPKGTNQWWPDWMNYNRQHCPADYFVHLDADEVLHEEDYERIRKLAETGNPWYCRRYNFWHDPRHLIPEGKCCGSRVLRLARSQDPIPSDYPYGPAEATCIRALDSDIGIYHYGFLCERSAFFRKAREVQRIWTNSFDPRLEQAEAFEGNWSAMPGVTGWENKLDEFTGTHPKVVHQWLKNRHYELA